MAFEIDIGFSSVAGRKPVNEDFCAAMLPDGEQEHLGSILAIADGVSTGGMGKEAAQTTVTSLVRDYYSTPPTWDTTVALDRIITAQNTWLCGINKRRSPALGLTTLTALVLRGQTWTLAHVGDTRAYLLRDRVITQLSTDHTVNHPDFRHRLLRSIGAQNHVVVDYLQGDLQVGDVFVLLSDGVYNHLDDTAVVALVDGAGVQEASQRLLDSALVHGGNDNLTAMVARVESLQDATLEDMAMGAQALPTPARLRTEQTIDGLAVTTLVADTGVNLIYQVRDPATQKLYALKCLNPTRANDVQERAMLVHEGWLARHLKGGRMGRHLVAIHDHPPGGAPRSGLYLLYDWHGGETLQQLLDRGSRSGPAQVIDAMQQALKVLGYLHRQGVVHRDVKPANLHLGTDGVLRLLDLGVALSGKEPESMRRLHAGTPSYVNPEQWGYSPAGNPVEEELPTPQSDLYALGVTLYQWLTGRLPYGEVLPHQTGRFFRDPAAPSRLNPQVPIWLDHIALKAVARDQRQRFETAEEMLLALERGASRPISAPPPSTLMQRDPAAIWKLGLAVSAIFNALLVYWLLFLPK
jgi:serine/threonine protein phosphatase PrpC